MDDIQLKRINLLLKCDLLHLYIVAMLGKGYNQSQIAKHLGLSCANIGQRLKRLNDLVGSVSFTDYKGHRGPKTQLTGAGSLFAMACLEALESLGIELKELKPKEVSSVSGYLGDCDVDSESSSCSKASAK